MYQPFELTESECLDLLNAGSVGRVALCTPNGPHIVPINYAMVAGAIVVRTTPYSVLGSHAHGSVIALEIDQLDYEHKRGWSVVARGRAEAVTDAAQLQEIRRSLEFQPWAAGNRTLYIRIRWQELTGRRLGERADLVGTAPTD
jgi:uncharacterized protein